MFARPAVLLATFALATAGSTVAAQSASADNCLSADQTGVCFVGQTTTLVPSVTVGGPVTVPSVTVGGDLTGGPIPVNSPTQICYLLGCIQAGQTLATVPDVFVPPVTTPSDTVPVPTETTPEVDLPFDPTQPYVIVVQKCVRNVTLGTICTDSLL
jgi:hypothetical protein